MAAPNVQGRKAWLDTLRGLAMLFVIIGHAWSDDIPGKAEWSKLIGPVMLPLFFAISGYLFNGYGGNAKAFFTNLYKKILIPTVFLSLIWLKVLFIPVRGMDYYISHVWDLVSGKALWYLNAHMVAQTLHFFIRKYCRRPGTICAACLACFMVGMMMACAGVGGFFMMDRGFIAQLYMLIGYLFWKYEDKLIKVRGGGGYCLQVSYILGCGLRQCGSGPV